MNKLFFVIALLLLSTLVYAREVSATNQGIANASPGDYIIRSSGEKVVLKQSDIDYARRQLRLEPPLIPTPKPTPIRPTSSNSNGNTMFIIVIICIVHIILTIAVYKMKGGGWACFYFFLAPLALLLFLEGVDALSKSNKKDIYHHFH